MERRGCVDRLYWMVNQQWEEPLNKAKPFVISKQVVWKAYQRVKANQGAAGVDGESIAEFERNLKETSTNSGIGCHPGVTFHHR